MSDPGASPAVAVEGPQALTATPGDTDDGSNRARRGVGLLAGAGAVAGGLNYAFLVVVGTCLSASDFVVVAAGQGLLLVVGSAAASTLPWLTAQELALAGEVPARRRAVARASVVSAAVLGAAAGGLVALASSFASPPERWALATAAALVCLGQVGTGWAQGSGRYAVLAALVVGEAALKVGTGALAAAAGGGAVGALAGACAGGGLLVAVGVVLVAPPLRAQAGAAVRPTRWWRAAGAVGTARSAVAALTVADVVVVAAVVPASPSVAHYQLAMSLGRVPVFLATAVAQAYLGVLTRRAGSAPLAEETWRRLLVLALPAAAAVATVPAPVAARLLPSGAGVTSYLPAAATTGLAMGLVQLVSTWGQAAQRWRRLVPTLLGLLVLHVAVVLGAASATDLHRVATVTAASAAAVVAVLAVVLTRPARWRAWPPRWTVLAVALLVVARPAPALWLAATAVVGALTLRQMLPGGSKAR